MTLMVSMVAVAETAVPVGVTGAKAEREGTEGNRCSCYADKYIGGSFHVFSLGV